MTSPTLIPYIEALERAVDQFLTAGYDEQDAIDAARLRALAEALKKAEYAWEYSTARHKAWLIPAPKEGA